MKTIYTYETGVKPWELTDSVIDSQYATITVVQRSVDELFYYWMLVVDSLVTQLPFVMKWLSAANQNQYSKVQELKLVKQLRDGLSGLDIFKKNPSTNIYSYLKNISSHIKQIDLNSLTAPRYTFIVFAPATFTKVDEIWESFKEADTGMTASILAETLKKYPELVICRVTEDSDTHATAQFIGKLETIELVRTTLEDRGIERARDDQIANLINE